MRPPPQDNSPCRDEVWKLWLMLAVVLAVTAAYWHVVSRHLLPDPPPAPDAARITADAEVSARRGEFGDMFGGLNALFSGLAFAGVVYALLLQRKDLQLQHQAVSVSSATLQSHVRLAAETAALQALVAQLDHWERMLASPGGTPETKERLARESAALADELAGRRAELDRRLAQLARDAGEPPGEPRA